MQINLSKETILYIRETLILRKADLDELKKKSEIVPFSEDFSKYLDSEFEKVNETMAIFEELMEEM